MSEALVARRPANPVEAPPSRRARVVPRSRFEIMAGLSNECLVRSPDLLDTLLSGVNPGRNCGGSVLQPLWAEEAMHRAYSLMRLAHTIGHGGPGHPNPIAAGVDHALARDLSDQFRSLDRSDARAKLPCAAILRDIVADLCALFGARANVTLRTEIARLALPMYQRRALILAACELVTNALLHAFTGCLDGRINVSLTAFGPRHACLLVSDNGVGFLRARPNLGTGVAAALADVLEADLTYERRNTWTSAEILLPVRA